jgi:hypothetical protein
VLSFCCYPASFSSFAFFIITQISVLVIRVVSIPTSYFWSYSVLDFFLLLQLHYIGTGRESSCLHRPPLRWSVNSCQLYSCMYLGGWDGCGGGIDTPEAQNICKSSQTSSSGSLENKRKVHRKDKNWVFNGWLKAFWL